jgi:hypothetical protein
MLKALFKVVWLKRKVSVQFDEEIPISGCQGGETIIEGFDNAAPGLSEPTVPSVQWMDPGMAARVVIENRTRVVG